MSSTPLIPPPLIGQATTWLSITSQLFTARMAALLDPFDITPGQYGILNHLARPDRADGQRISDIASAVQVNQPAVTKAVTKFENLNLVTLTADRKDKRARIVALAPGGRALLERIRAAIGPDLATAYGVLGPEDLQTLTTLLQRLGGWLDENRL